MQGIELRNLRKEMGLSQGELATALDLTSTFIGMMERGERKIDLRTECTARMIASDLRRKPQLEEQVRQLSDGRLSVRSSTAPGEWKDVTADQLADARRELREVSARLEARLPGQA